MVQIGPKLPEPVRPGAKDYVAMILAVGFMTAVNAITISFLVRVIFQNNSEGLSENTTQVLITAFGGVIAILGSYVGYKIGYWDGKRWQFDDGQNGMGEENGPETTQGP